MSLPYIIDSLTYVFNLCIEKKEKKKNNNLNLKKAKNNNGTFMSFKSFKEKIGIKTDYITYIGCVQAIKSYIRKTEITVEAKNSADLIKTLKTIYNQQ